MRIAFMGTPEFAVPSLQALYDAGYEVAGAFTQPDRPAGRGNKLSECPVKARARELAIPVFQFERLRRAEGVEALSSLRPDYAVTAAFGQILSQTLLDVPRFGTVNVHASLLPAYRGAAPVNWCIYMGEERAGVTTMMTDAGIDTGDMLLQRETPIGEMETAGELLSRLSHIGAALLIETLQSLERGDCPRVKQDPAKATHQPMLKKEMGKIDFGRSAREIACQVRGFNPWPGAYALLPEGALKIWLARPAHGEFGGRPGEVLVSSPKQGLIVRCGEGALEILELQAPNAKRMAAKAYLAGKPLPVGARLQ